MLPTHHTLPIPIQNQKIRFPSKTNSGKGYFFNLFPNLAYLHLHTWYLSFLWLWDLLLFALSPSSILLPTYTSLESQSIQLGILQHHFQLAGYQMLLSKMLRGVHTPLAITTRFPGYPFLQQCFHPCLGILPLYLPPSILLVSFILPYHCVGILPLVSFLPP